ncbi:hypothetical protein MBLNU230_g4542t1 [Neophaeotheca triangularis]
MSNEFAKAFDAANYEHKPPPWHDRPCKPSSIASESQRAIDVYMMSQRPNGEMGGIGWWQTANGYTAMALHDKWSGQRQNYPKIAQAMKKCESECHKDFINEFNDDTLWWGLLCCHMYELEKDGWFLEKAKVIWQYIKNGKSCCGRGQYHFNDQDMEGAVFWTTRPGEGQINSITTGLFAELSVRLALIEMKRGDATLHPNNNNTSRPSSKERRPSSRDTTEEKRSSWRGLGGFLNSAQKTLKETTTPLITPNKALIETYLSTARTSLAWILRCRYRPREAVVLDTIKLKKQESLDWAFTYLTGVTLSACVLMYEATREKLFMVLACHMAHRAMRNSAWVEADGVLTESGAYGKGKHNPVDNNDSVGFKSVLVRALGVLLAVIRRTGCTLPEARMEEALVGKFLAIQFEALRHRNCNDSAQYGPWWAGPMEKPTSHSQLAVLDVMAAVKLVDR